MLVTLSFAVSSGIFSFLAQYYNQLKPSAGNTVTNPRRLSLEGGEQKIRLFVDFTLARDLKSGWTENRKDDAWLAALHSLLD